MSVILYNYTSSKLFKASGVNASGKSTFEKQNSHKKCYVAARGATSKIKGNPFQRSLKPARAAFNTRLIQISSQVKAIRAEHKARKEQAAIAAKYRQCVDLRDFYICSQADITASKMFSCRGV